MMAVRHFIYIHIHAATMSSETVAQGQHACAWAVVESNAFILIHLLLKYGKPSYVVIFSGMPKVSMVLSTHSYSLLM